MYDTLNGSAHQSEMDGSPLRLVADAFLLGARENVAEFEW